jgi:thiol-disulfide isomerase/thioredoxin
MRKYCGIPATLVVTLLLLLLLFVVVSEALLLSTHTQHHRRRPSASRVPKAGPLAAPNPPVRSNTRRRRTTVRSSSSPLVVFYGMFLDRFRGPPEAKKNSSSLEKPMPMQMPIQPPEEEELFAEDMIQRKQEFIQRFEHFRGRGRWGGYELQGISQQQQQQQQQHYNNSTTKPATAPLSIVSGTARKKPPKRLALTRGDATRPILQINDIQQYKQQVVDANDASVVVVRFYAAWCKACKAVESSFYRLPNEFPSTIKFVEVPLTKENAYLHKGLGVSSLPFAHIYYNPNYECNTEDSESTKQQQQQPSCTLVEELKIGKSHFREFKRTLRSYVDQECEVYYHSSPEEGLVLSPSPRCKPIRTAKPTTTTTTNNQHKDSIAENEQELASPVG